ncbi:MAG: hypothetical protein ABIK68_10595 [bacterium]
MYNEFQNRDHSHRVLTCFITLCVRQGTEVDICALNIASHESITFQNTP